MLGFNIAHTTRSFPNQFPVHTFTAVQRPQAELRGDITILAQAHILGLWFALPRVPTTAVTHLGLTYYNRARAPEYNNLPGA